MKHRFFSLTSSLLVLVVVAKAQQPQLPCERGLTGEGQLIKQQRDVNSLVDKLYVAYQTGDKKQEDDLQENGSEEFVEEVSDHESDQDRGWKH